MSEADKKAVIIQTCCNNPDPKPKANEMFESWIECDNCGKEILTNKIK